MDAVKRMEELQQRMLEMSQSGNMDMNEYMQIAGEMQGLAALAQQQQVEQLFQDQQEQHRQMMQEMGHEPDAQDEADFQAMLARQQAQLLGSPLQGADAQALFQAAAQEAMDLVSDLMDDEDEGMDEEAYAAFVREHAPPAEHARYLPIGALLIGTHLEPYETLAVTQDAEDTLSILENGWGIQGREEALAMMESLLGGRHANQFADTYRALRAGQTDGLDEDDVEDYEAAAQAVVEILELPQALVESCETLLAWDLERVGYLARLFVNVGFLTEAEAWEWMARAGAEIKTHFRSWEEYLVSLLIGRSVCYSLDREPFAVALDLLTDSRSFLDAHPIAAL